MPPRREETRSGSLKRLPRAGRFRRSRAAFLLAGLCLPAALLAGRAALARWGTVPARYGQVTLAVRGEALVVRQERPLFAEVAGRVVPSAREGERIPRGALVARVDPSYGRSAASLAAAGEARWLRAPLAGTVSYVLDGLEGLLGPQNLPELLRAETPAADVARGAEARAIRPQQQVTPGEPVAKVIDNFQVWLVADFPSSAAPSLPRVGDRVRLRLLGAGTPAGAVCRATVTGRRDRRRGSRLILAPVEYWPEFGRVRRTALELILGEYEGVLVPRTALVKRNGATGVIVWSVGGRRFQAVTVQGGDDEWVAVDGLAPGTPVSEAATRGDQRQGAREAGR